MSENRKDLPAPSAPNFEQRLRETVMTYLGKQGDPLDRGLTVRDLVANGVLKLGAGWKGGSGLVPLVPGTALDVPDGDLDLTPPPTPTGFAVDGAISHVFIEHDAPLYRQGHGHKQTRVYGVNPTEAKPNPVFADAIELGQFAGQVWAMPSNPSTTWHLWIKWETNDGVLSIDPAGGTNGLVVRTGEDVGLLLDAMTGTITQGQLYQDLSSRIDLIDGNHPGSVNDRIQGAIQNEASVRADETGDLFAKYTVKVDVAGHVSGYGLASTGNAAAAFSEFGVLADRFFISPPATSSNTAPTTNLYPGRVWVDTSTSPSVTKYYTGSSWSTTPQALPFIVQTSPIKVDDIDIPAGVYMNAAYIKNGTITNAKIGKAAIDDAKIANLSASKITSGEIAVGREIKSSGFIANSGSTAGTGWRIGGNGNAEFSNATVRGTVYATNGQFWGTLLGGAATAFNSGLGFYAGGGSTADGTKYRWRVGNPSGARIQWTGSAVEVYNASNTLAFSSGGIAWDSVTGKPIFGDLAAKDSLGYTEITGTKPPSDADKTSSNVAKGITNQGAFATLGKLTKYNISTYIETAAITKAYIGNAEIDTLKLAGNAVTVPQIATSGDALTGDLTWKTVIETSITLDSSGTVMANFACKQGFFSFPNAWLFKMYIDGTVVFEVGGTSGIDSIAMVGAKSISVASNSTKAVTIKVVWNSNNQVQVLNRSLWVMGAKR